MKRSVFLLALVALIVGGVGCNSPMKRINHALSDEQEHKADIGSVVDKFHQALYWGDTELASAFVNPDIRDDFFLQTNRRKEQERVLEAQVQQIKVDENQDNATVMVSIKYFNIPNYIVKTRHEKQEWEFNTEEGRWLFKDSQVESVS